jgi:endonuclease/exonuclease/phosphatase family metal-dependent hydrolase
MTISDSTFARNCYRWHGIISQPTYRVIEYFTRYGNPVDPAVFDNCSTKAREYAYRAFGPAALIGVAAFLAKKATLPQVGLIVAGLLAFEVGRLVLHLLAYATQKKNYIHVRGNAAEAQPIRPKIMSWNVFGFPAGMNYTCGGCIPFRHRFAKIAEQIRNQKADIVILQECWMDASVSEAFVDEFKDEYAHFFIHNDPNKLGLESGVLVMTKCAITNYTFTPFNNNPWTLSRGFATLSIPARKNQPAFAVIGTHLHDGPSPVDAQKKTDQLKQIHDHAKSLSDVNAVILAGDLNMNAATPEVQKILGEVLVNFHSTGLETCTTEMNKIRYPDDPSPPKEWIDQVSIIKRNEHTTFSFGAFKIIEVYRVDGKIDSKTALSDHNAVVAVLLPV